MSGAAPKAGRLRLFFALWPSDAQRQALVAAIAGAIAPIEGRVVPAGNLHVTLAFLGPVPGRSFVKLVAVGGRGDDPAVELGFSRLEYWPEPRVVVAIPGKVPSTAARIVNRLWAGLLPLGFKRENRPWQPHLTVIRRVRGTPPADFGPRLPAKAAAAAATGWGLALVESSTHPEGVRYRPLAEWPLT